ncbi:hypothetical protein RRF57_004554 [Xylaria bambusicola]|uniref:T6SS Phospholipase effector Tle1-like catalytic domain-containing protein n=1 Tax=Xylaria bambusicola TaxID=326684 RepID=A0AAN7UIA1_9PEZI
MFTIRIMDPHSHLHEQHLTTTQGYALSSVLDHSNDLIDKAVDMGDRMRGTESESEITSKLFRAINEEAGKRRLFVCCDGTWVNASGTTAPLTNVARFARAIDRFGLNREHPLSPVTQVIYYSAGIGSEPVLKTRVDSIYSGITGAGLEEDILNAYCFLCNNYNFGARNDEIILIGFSRGAFTVRCLADFISQVGLLQRRSLPFLSVLFQRWMDAKGEEDRKRMKLEIRKMSQEFSLPVRITVLAEWDTVSAIGHVGWRNKFSFMKETVPENVQNAFLAIALNERRGSFMPMLYSKARRGTSVAQCAFCGCHGDIGGGNLDAGLSTVSLLWMAAKVQGACHASFDRTALLQMVQPPRPNAKWWYGRKDHETEAMNLLWSKGIWLLPHLLTLGWSSGSRRRHFRKNFGRRETNKTQVQDKEQERNRQTDRTQKQLPAKIYRATYDNNTINDAIKGVSEDVTDTIKDSLIRAGKDSKLKNTQHTTASIKTAIHVNSTGNAETRFSAIIDAKFKASPSDQEASIDPRKIIEINNTPTETAFWNSPHGDDHVECSLKIHFTAKELVRELRYRSKEGALERLWEKLGLLGHERWHLAEYLPQEAYDENEKRLWEEWKSQVDMWHASNEGRKGGWDKDVVYWSDVLARFDKGDSPDSQARKEMVQWEVCTDQLCRVADATAATAQAGLQTAAANTTEAESELEFATRAVTKVAEVADLQNTGDEAILRKVWSVMDDVKGAFGRVPVEILTGTLAKVVAGVAQILPEDNKEENDSQPAAKKETGDSDKDVQKAIRSATGQLAGIAGVLAQVLYPANVDPIIEGSGKANEKDDGDLRDKISQAKDAADRMVQSAKVLQNVSVPDTDAWEEMKSYAVRAREAAERAAKAIANATIQWKLTDEQRREALCYRISYPSLKPTDDGRAKDL